MALSACPYVKEERTAEQKHPVNWDIGILSYV